jgi:hypothetical protein
MKPRLVTVTLLLALAAAGCGVKLPDPESPGAKLYSSRCNNCHRLFAPSSLKPEMWKIQVERMQGEMARRGIPPLSGAERDVLLEYLRQHSG